MYLVGSIVLVTLAGCGHGFFQTAEREPWRAEAEIACLKSGDVKEGPDLVRIEPISGPGVCGADYPLKRKPACSRRRGPSLSRLGWRGRPSSKRSSSSQRPTRSARRRRTRAIGRRGVPAACGRRFHL